MKHLALALVVAVVSMNIPAGAEEPTACAALADALARARASGGLERIVGLHPFVLERRYASDDGAPTGEHRFLMTYDVAVVETALTVGVRVFNPGERLGVAIDYAVDPTDGRLLTLRSNAQGGETAADRAGDRLVVRAPGADEVRHPWTDAVLPKIVAAFVLPMLHEHGLPQLVRYRDVDPFGRLSRIYTLSSLPTTPGAPVRVFDSWEGRPRPVTTVHVAATGPDAGKVVLIRTESQLSPDGRHVVHLATGTRLDPDRFQRVLRREEPLEQR